MFYGFRVSHQYKEETKFNQFINMKSEIIKVDEVQKLPKEEVVLVEKLDFSELIDVKGGGNPPVNPSKGNAGGTLSHCSCD